MGQKWGNNKGIHIGDIFWCAGPPAFLVCTARADYYQVVALRGRTQVVLRAIHKETFINEGVRKDSPLYWRSRKRIRPLPGQFMTEEELGHIPMSRDGINLLPSGVEVTAWVLPEKSSDGTYRLVEVGWKKSIGFYMEHPEDWKLWDAEAIKKLEEEYYTDSIAASKRWLGEEGYARYCKEHAEEQIAFAKRCLGEEGYARYCEEHAAEMRILSESKPDGYDG